MWKIVIVDDDKQVLQGMKQVIPWEELDAEWAGEALNGEEGLALIKNVQPDIVITDIYMPVMSGIEMVEKLSSEQFNGKIIILSGYSDFEYARKALRLGISDYLNKPLSVQTIKEVLQNMISLLEVELEKKNKSIELEQRLQLYEPFVEKEWVKSIVTSVTKGPIYDAPILPRAYEHWLRNEHVVVGIEMIPTERVVASSKSLSLFRFAVSNIIHEVCQEHAYDFEYVELFSNHLAIIIHVEKGEKWEHIQQKLQLLARHMIQSVKTYLQMTIHIGIGDLKVNWLYIPESTEEAFQAINAKKYVLDKEMPIYSYSCALNNNVIDSVNRRPVKLYQQMLEAIKAFQEEKAISTVQQYCEQLKSQGEGSGYYFEQLAQELWTLFTYALFEVNVQLEEIVSEAEVKREIRIIHSIEQFEQWLYQMMRRICSYKQNIDLDNIKHKRAIDFIVEYIHQHYAEPITISDLADRIYISRNYLSYLFKKAMGESFNHYLTRVRMEKAKEMIVEGKHLIYEVAEFVGYKNVPYFSAQFKKYTGKNPTDLYKIKPSEGLI